MKLLFSLLGFRPFKCPQLYTTMISGEKQFTPKKKNYFSKIKSRQIALLKKNTLKYTILLKYPYKYNNKRMRKCKPNTVCLEQKNYASQELFSQPLVMMVETFRRSVGLGYPFTATFLSNNFCFNALNTVFSLGKTKQKHSIKSLQCL